MPKNRENESAVSAVVGEMLMIGIVLILVAVFSASLPGYLPSERSPTVTIKVCYDNTSGTITLWHKGGDWVKASSLKVIVSNTNDTFQKSFRLNDPVDRFILVPDNQAFDLNSTIMVDWEKSLEGNEKIVLATDRAVIYSGSVGGVCP